ncbi:MAG TPA: glycosyltransferase [Terriglobales bacterium]|nr:glycosyltransferase [Terriglobales bacterium]
MRKLTIVFHHAGGGHKSAADALKATLSSQKEPWDVTLLDIQALLDPLDLIRRFTGLRIQDTYNAILRKGWTRVTPALLVVLKSTIWIYHAPIVKLLRTYWAENPADLVLSVVPHFNREIAESLRPVGGKIVGGKTAAKTPFVTLITDLADYPPHFWIERESEYIIAGTEKARQQALAIGVPTDHVFLTSGMILKPKFYERIAVDRVAERKKLGLEPDCPTAIVLFGGHGSQVMVDITKILNEANSGVQLILICGHNEKLAEEIKKLPTKKPIAVVGFASNVEYYMALADFFIGKPGPGSISEALQFHLPVIVECNGATLPQERYNAEWVTEKGYGIVVRSFKEIAPAVQRLLDSSTFAEFQTRTGQYSNRALFEAPVILDQCAERTTAATEPQPV